MATAVGGDAHVTEPPARPMATGLSRAPLATMHAWCGAGLALRPGALVVALGLTVACWSFLAWRYSASALIANPQFYLGKVEPLYRLTPDLFAFVVLSVSYLWGYACLRSIRHLGRALVAAVLVTLLVAGVANVVLYPVGARDVFHYLMVLDVAATFHGNPYVDLYSSYAPDVFAHYGFLPSTPLGYGPGWLLLSLLPAPLAGFGSVLRTLLVYKAYDLAVVVMAAAAIWLHCGRGRTGLAAAYLYALNPLVLFEGVGNGHNDVMMALFLVLAVIAMQRRRLSAAALLVVAASVKFYVAPVALVFTCYMLRQHWSPRRIAAATLLAAVTGVAVVAPFWAGGQMLAGLRDGGVVYLRELYSCSLLSLVRQAAVESGAVSVSAVEASAAVALLAITGSALRAGRRSATVAVLTAIVLGWALLLATNLFPWYLVTLVAVIAVAEDEDSLGYLFPATLLGALYYFVSITCWSVMSTRSFLIHVLEAGTTTLPLLAYVVWRTVALARGR